MAFQGGYDVEVIESYQDALNCVICTLVIKKATNGCECHVFCHSCLETYLNNKMFPKCPGGCGKSIHPSKLSPVLAFDMMINKLKTKCSNQGCSWTGDLLDLVKVHKDQCIYSLTKCVRDGCHETFLKQDAENHEQFCSYKALECMWCQNKVLRINKVLHESSCSNEEVACTYVEVGCKVVMSRKDVVKHEQDHQSLHMKLSFQNTKKNEKFLIQENKDLKEEILRLKEVSTKEINRVKENSTKEINRVEKIVTDKQYLSLQVLKLKLNNRFTDVIELHIDNCSLLITLSECNFNDVFIKLLNKPSDYYNLDHQIKIVNELKKQHNGIDKSLLLEVLCNQPYHWYRTIHTRFDVSLFLCFPIQENEIKDFRCEYQEHCVVRSTNNVIQLDIMKGGIRDLQVALIIDGEEIKMENRCLSTGFRTNENLKNKDICCGGIRILLNIGKPNQINNTTRKRKSIN